tara:strand:- start:9543 stop:10463 length:921 start_codon:yes stop_codon:yes gene_type:complete
MKKILFISALFALPFLAVAQDEEPEPPKDGWTKSGNATLLFNQAAFNAEWTGGGTSNYAANGALTYDANYRKGKLTWDNRLMAEYGITKTRDQEFTRKTNDRFELNSIVGRQIKETKWYYSWFANFRTQLSNGYEFIEDETTGEETRVVTTKFLSPAYFQTGPGLLWKESDNLKVNISPATLRLIIVDDQFTTVPNNQAAIDAYNEAGPYFGVDANETIRYELGASINAYAKFEIMDNVTAENVLQLYSNYLEDPQNVDVDYTLNLLLKVNEWITANFTFQAIYDDNAVKGFQIRETLGIGVGYKF